MTADQKLRHAAWARTLLLIVTSVACLTMCQAYIRGLDALGDRAASSGALQVLDAMPGGLPMWAGVFGLLGLAGLVVAATGCRCTWLILAMGATWGAWGFVFLFSWLLGLQSRGYVTATSFLLIDVLLSALLLLPARRHK